MYNETRKLYDRIASQDQCITFLLVELRAVQKRLEKLEKPTNAALRKLAHDNVEALVRVDQHTDL
jgi:hypothetical protein